MLDQSNFSRVGSTIALNDVFALRDLWLGQHAYCCCVGTCNPAPIHALSIFVDRVPVYVRVFVAIVLLSGFALYSLAQSVCAACACIRTHFGKVICECIGLTGLRCGWLIGNSTMRSLLTLVLHYVSFVLPAAFAFLLRCLGLCVQLPCANHQSGLIKLCQFNGSVVFQPSTCRPDRSAGQVECCGSCLCCASNRSFPITLPEPTTCTSTSTCIRSRCRLPTLGQRCGQSRCRPYGPGLSTLCCSVLSPRASLLLHSWSSGFAIVACSAGTVIVLFTRG